MIVHLIEIEFWLDIQKLYIVFQMQFYFTQPNIIKFNQNSISIR